MCGSGHLVQKKDNSDPLENSVVDDCVEDCSERKKYCFSFQSKVLKSNDSMTL